MPEKFSRQPRNEISASFDSKDASEAKEIPEKFGAEVAAVAAAAAAAAAGEVAKRIKPECTFCVKSRCCHPLVVKLRDSLLGSSKLSQFVGD